MRVQTTLSPPQRLRKAILFVALLSGDLPQLRHLYFLHLSPFVNSPLPILSRYSRPFKAGNTPFSNMSSLLSCHVFFFCALIILVTGQQQCYFGPGAQFRSPSNLAPCNGAGTSACCLLGDTCLSGNICYNYANGNLYQYGCTDIK